MCGRFTLAMPYEAIIRRFAVQHASGKDRFKYNYNVAPGQPVLAVIRGSSGNRLGFLRWGLVPSWAKDEKIGYKLINARAESITKKPSFRDAFRRRRCLIIADSFYEWGHRPPTEKVPYRFHMKSEELFAMAGLWDTWTSEDQKVLHTCTIITTEANALMRPIHDRMPVILSAEDEAKWLDPATETDELLQMLRPADAADMQAYEVSRDVNSVRNNAAYLIDRRN